jgi:hypothetical protein
MLVGSPIHGSALACFKTVLHYCFSVRLVGYYTGAIGVVGGALRQDLIGVADNAAPEGTIYTRVRGLTTETMQGARWYAVQTAQGACNNTGYCTDVV